MLNLASYLDSTNLKPDAQWPDIEKLCQDAIDYQMAAVCIHPHWVARARKCWPEPRCNWRSTG